MRVAIISTPRSGNTWLRLILAGLYKCESLPVHSPDALDWHTLPRDFVLQLHWHRTAELMSCLDGHAFRIVTIARHPLDVLVSILHFAPREPQTAQWLRGEAGDEMSIRNAVPTSAEFVAYCTGARARALLSVTRDWWDYPNAERIRYEQLVVEPTIVLRTLLYRLGGAVKNIDSVLQDLTMEKLRFTSQNQHYWQGRPGLWKALLPKPVAMAIAQVQAGSFEGLGYRCDPDPSLTAESARAAWERLQA